MPKNVCQEIAENLIGFDSQESTFLKLKGATYTAMAIKMAENAINFRAIQETLATCPGSDWPKNPDGTPQGSNKATKAGSVYARSYERFASWYRLQFRTDEDGVPIVENGAPVKKEKNSGAGKRKETSGKIEALPGSDSVTVVLRDLFCKIDTDRTSKKPGAVKAAKALLELANYLGIKL